jgi:hypothetical protein
MTDTSDIDARLDACREVCYLVIYESFKQFFDEDNDEEIPSGLGIPKELQKMLVTLLALGIFTITEKWSISEIEFDAVLMATQRKNA